MTSKFVTFPHCDARILHPPGECHYCDKSGLQEVREAWGIAFTGQVTKGLKSCPADQARSSESLNSWPGNRPVNAGSEVEVVVYDERDWKANS